MGPPSLLVGGLGKSTCLAITKQSSCAFLSSVFGVSLGVGLQKPVGLLFPPRIVRQVPRACLSTWESGSLRRSSLLWLNSRAVLREALQGVSAQASQIELRFVAVLGLFIFQFHLYPLILSFAAYNGNEDSRYGWNSYQTLLSVL